MLPRARVTQRGQSQPRWPRGLVRSSLRSRDTSVLGRSALRAHGRFPAPHSSVCPKPLSWSMARGCGPALLFPLLGTCLHLRPSPPGHPRGAVASFRRPRCLVLVTERPKARWLSCPSVPQDLPPLQVPLRVSGVRLQSGPGWPAARLRPTSPQCKAPRPS